MAKTKYIITILLLYWNPCLSFFRVVFEQITTMPTKGAYGFHKFFKQTTDSFYHGMVVEIWQI